MQETGGKTQVLFDENQIRQMCKTLGEKITSDYKDKNLLVVSVLRGAMIFTADLVRQIEVPMKLDCVITSSYGSSTQSSGDVNIIKDVDYDLTEFDILLVDDILDTGYTLKKLIEHFSAKKPKSLKTCVFLSKPDRREVDIDADYLAKEVPDYFLIGYGLDYAEKYRNLPYITVLVGEK